KLPALLRQASVGLIPNLSSAATNLMLPVKLMEYAALGVPVVAARLKVIEHYFGENAVRFFKPGDELELANAMEEMCGDSDLRQRLASRAAAIVEKLSWREQRLAYYDAIDSLLTPAPAPVKYPAENRQ